MLEQTDILILYRETVIFLDRLSREVREGKNVMLASQFARWLQFSGLNKVFETYPCNRPHCEVDAVVLEKKTKDLLFECGELFRGGRADPKYAASDIAEINRKLDTVLLTLARPMSVTTIVNAPKPELKGDADSLPRLNDMDVAVDASGFVERRSVPVRPLFANNL